MRTERTGEGALMLLAERPRPRVVREHPNAGWFAVATVCFGAFMGQLDASIVTLAFPALQRQFAAPLAAVQWVSLAYLLTLVGLLAAAGRVADAAGRKSMYVYGFGLFTAASAACGFAPALGFLVGLRVVQAVGAAMLQANSVALVVTSVPGGKRRAALGVQAGAQALGLAAGPALGGLLVSSLGWRWVFWVNVPVGIAGIVAGQFLLMRTRHRTALGRFDGAGVVLLALASAMLLLALSAAAGLAMPGWATAAAAATAVSAAAGFGWRERRAASPLIEPGVLRPAAVSIGLAGALCGYLVLFGPMVLLPQMLGAHGTAGLVLTCLPAGFALAAVAADPMLPAGLGARGRAAGGAMAAAAGCAALGAAPHTLWLSGLLLALVGAGLGVFIPANNSSIMAAVPPRMSAAGGGLVNMARGLGTALGVAVVALCLHAAGHRDGARLALAALALAGAAAAVTGLFARGHRAATPTLEGSL